MTVISFDRTGEQGQYEEDVTRIGQMGRCASLTSAAERDRRGDDAHWESGASPIADLRIPGPERFDVAKPVVRERTEAEDET